MEGWEKSWNDFLLEPFQEEYGKILGEYLAKSTAFTHPYYGERLRTRVENLQNYFGGEIPESVQKRFIQNQEFDYILENLQTHDIQGLFKALQKAFGEEVIQSYQTLHGQSKDSASVKLHGTKEVPLTDLIDLKNLKPTEKLPNILEFWGYHYVSFQNGFLTIEASHPERVDVSSGHVYHITEKTLAPFIFKSGLRCSNTTRVIDPETGNPIKLPAYRNFPKRVGGIFVEKSSKKNLQAKILETLSELGRQPENVVVFRIDCHCNWYWDTAMENSYSVCTYTNIPGNFLTPIDVGYGIPGNIRKMFKNARIFENQYDHNYKREDYFKKKGIEWPW